MNNPAGRAMKKYAIKIDESTRAASRVDRLNAFFK
jgi:hypothetical protein